MSSKLTMVFLQLVVIFLSFNLLTPAEATPVRAIMPRASGTPTCGSYSCPASPIPNFSVGSSIVVFEELYCNYGAAGVYLDQCAYSMVDGALDSANSDPADHCAPQAVCVPSTKRALPVRKATADDVKARDVSMLKFESMAARRRRLAAENSQ